MNYVESLDLFGTPLKEIPCIKGKGKPTEDTVGSVGLFYMDTDSGAVYKCTNVVGNTYIWGLLGQDTPKTASVGQTIRVKAVDENGKPSEWEAVDYQPRTHYKEDKVLLPETVVTNINEYEDYNECIISPIDFTFTDGNRYKVVWNGITYETTAFTTNGLIFIGRNFDGTGVEPFRMASANLDLDANETSTTNLCILAYDHSTILTLSITELDSVVKIPDEYISTPNFNAEKGEPGHILNRTHYTGTGYVVPETVCEIGEDGMFEFSCDDKLIADNVYTVKWNGIDYTCKCKTFIDQSDPVATPAYFLGNIDKMMGSGDTGEPFIVACAVGETGTYNWLAHSFDVSTAVTFSVIGEKVVQLPSKYLPSYTLEVSFDELTSLDNGTVYCDRIGIPIDLLEAVASKTPVYIRVFSMADSIILFSYTMQADIACTGTPEMLYSMVAGDPNSEHLKTSMMNFGTIIPDIYLGEPRRIVIRYNPEVIDDTEETEPTE